MVGIQKQAAKHDGVPPAQVAGAALSDGGRGTAAHADAAAPDERSAVGRARVARAPKPPPPRWRRPGAEAAEEQPPLFQELFPQPVGVCVKRLACEWHAQCMRHVHLYV